MGNDQESDIETKIGSAVILLNDETDSRFWLAYFSSLV